VSQLDFAHSPLLIAHRSNLAVFPVQKILHSFAARSVGAFIGFERIGRVRPCGFFFAAIRTAVSEPRLAGLEFEFLSANYAGFDRVRHLLMIPGLEMQMTRRKQAYLRVP